MRTIENPVASESSLVLLGPDGKAVRPADMKDNGNPEAPLASSENMLSIIAQAAANPAVDVQKMQALLDMQIVIRREEARTEFIRAFVSMSAKMPSIKKDGTILIEKNGRIVQKTPYATFEALHKAVSPLLKANNFAFWTEPDIGAAGVGIVIRGHLDHISGHGTSCVMSLPPDTTGSKNSTQAIGSSISYGRRYCLMNLCNIASEAPEDRDRDGNPKGRRADDPPPTAALVTKKQLGELREAMKTCGVTEGMVCQKYEIDALEDMPVEMFGAAMKACGDFRTRQTEKAVKRGLTSGDYGED
jgi:hypothetical protein